MVRDLLPLHLTLLSVNAEPAVGTCQTEAVCSSLHPVTGIAGKSVLPECGKDGIGCLLHDFGGKLEFGFAEVHVALRLEGYEVDVGVVDFKPEHCHAYFAAGVCLTDGGGDTLGKDNHAGEFVVGEVEEIVYFALGHYEGVTLGKGVDVEKGVELVVLGTTVGGYFALNDFGEDGHFNV